MAAVVVLHLISPTGYYGAERWVVAQSRHLDPSKIEVHIAVTREGNDESPEILERGRELGLSTHEIHLAHRFDPRAASSVAKLACALNASILHGHGYKSDLLAVLARRRAETTVVSTPHGFEKALNPKMRLYFTAGRWALQRADVVAPLSLELEKALRGMGIPQHRIRLIENGVDLEEIEAELLRPVSTESTLRRFEDERLLVYVGRLTPLKNLDTMIQAFAKLCERRDGVRLLLVGEGPEAQALKQLVASSAARGRVEFLGYREDRLSLLRHCDIFSMSSRSEGIPRSMMEAMALGLPAVAFSIPGVDKLLLNRKTGLGVRLDDREAMAAAWERLLDDEALRARLGSAARQHIVKHYSAQRMAREYEVLYRELGARAT